MNRKKKSLLAAFMSIHLPTCKSSAHTGQIFVKFDTGYVYVHLSRNYKFGYNRTKIPRTLYEDM